MGIYYNEGLFVVTVMIFVLVYTINTISRIIDRHKTQKKVDLVMKHYGAAFDEMMDAYRNVMKQYLDD